MLLCHHIKSLCCVLVFFCATSCGQKVQAPAEIVRVSSGGSVMQRLNPVISRGGSGNILVVGDNLGNDDIDRHLVARNRTFDSKDKKHPPLYVSGPKAERQRTVKKRIDASRLKRREEPRAIDSGDRRVSRQPVHAK